MSNYNDAEWEAMTVFAQAFDAEGWDALTFDGAKLKVEAEVVPSDMSDDERDVLFDGDVPDDEPQTITTEFLAWMVMREASEDEYEAMKAGFRGETPEDMTDEEAVFHQKGLEEAERFPDEDDPEAAIAGRVPHPILYHRDPYTGPKHFGFSVDFRGGDGFSPSEAEWLKDEGDFVELQGTEMPAFRAFHPENGLTYEVFYWPDTE